MAMPTPVLPNPQAFTVSPANGLKEIRNSFTSTLASIEAALPGGAPKLSTQIATLPKIEEFFKGPGETVAQMTAAMAARTPPVMPAPSRAGNLEFE